MRAADLQVEDPALNRAEAAVGFGVEVLGQIAEIAQCQMQALVEVLAGLAGRAR